MGRAIGLAVAGFLPACAVEEPSGVSPETVEAAAEHAQLEVERDPDPAPKGASTAPR